jgi:hypothetical protein
MNNMNNMIFDLNKYEKGVGSIFACQLSIKLFIEDIKNIFTKYKLNIKTKEGYDYDFK